MPAKVVNLKFKYVNNSQWYQINIKHLICVVQILTEK